MDAQVENHLPLITPRLIFALQVFSPPPTITPRMEFPSLNIETRDDSPAPEGGAPTCRAETPPNRVATPSTVPRRAGTPGGPTLFNTAPRRARTPGSVAFALTDQHQRSISVTSSTEDEDKDLDELDSEAIGDSDRGGKIPKPKGDVSRLGRGGYNLQDKLGWNQRTYDNVLGLVSRLAREMLDTSQSYRSQSKRKIRSLTELVQKDYAFMDDYVDDWPVHDMLKTYLKNSSQTARNTKGKQVAENLKKIVNEASTSKSAK